MSIEQELMAKFVLLVTGYKSGDETGNERVDALTEDEAKAFLRATLNVLVDTGHL